MSYWGAREPLSKFLRAAPLLPPADGRRDFPLLSIFHVPLLKHRISTADFEATGVNFLDVLDEVPKTRLRQMIGSLSEPKNYSLRENRLRGSRCGLNTLTIAGNAGVRRTTYGDVLLVDEQHIELEGKEPKNLIDEQMHRRSVLERLLSTTDVQNFVAGKKRFVLGIVIKLHTAKIHLCSSTNVEAEGGGGAAMGYGNTIIEMGSRSTCDHESYSDGAIGIRCMYFAIKKDEIGRPVASNPVIDVTGSSDKVMEAVRYVRGGMFRMQGFCGVVMREDLRDGDLTVDNREARRRHTERALFVPRHSALGMPLMSASPSLFALIRYFYRSHAR